MMTHLWVCLKLTFRRKSVLHLDRLRNTGVVLYSIFQNKDTLQRNLKKQDMFTIPYTYNVHYCLVKRNQRDDSTYAGASTQDVCSGYCKKSYVLS